MSHGPETATDVLPRTVPRDEESVRVEREVRERMIVLRQEMHESLPALREIEAEDPVELAKKLLPESDCHGFEPPRDGGILPIDPAGDADRQSLHKALHAQHKRIEKLEAAVKAVNDDLSAAFREIRSLRRSL